MTHIKQMAEAMHEAQKGYEPQTSDYLVQVMAQAAFSAIQPKIEGLVEALNIADEFVRSTKPRNPEEHEYISVDILHPIEKALESIKEWKL